MLKFPHLPPMLLATVAVWLLAAPSTARAEVAVLEAGRDATLIEDPGGTLANGSGPVFFAGHTSQEQNGLRRGLVRFDVAGALPADAVIEDVRLTLTTTGGNPATATVRLHRVLAPWSEGPTAARGGGGDDAQPGDVTWLHTFYDQEYWRVPGGQFVGAPSGIVPVAGEGAHTWQDARGLLHDVRLWLVAPRRNFGWAVLGNETDLTTAKRFASRENPDPSLRPRLEITYSRRSGGAAAAPTDSRSPRR